MNYAKIKDGAVVQYPYGLGELAQERPNAVSAAQYDLETCFASTDLPAAGFSLAAVAEDPVPNFDSLTQECTLSTTPEIVGGVWVLRWVVTDKDAEQLAIELYSRKLNVRARRNDLLAQSDWTQLNDSPVDKAAWAVYRQSLRDLTDQQGFPDKITWPEVPSAFGVARV